MENNVYISFIRSKLETSTMVWHSSLSDGAEEIWREFKSQPSRSYSRTTMIIMKMHFKLQVLSLETLGKRREILCLKFAKNCLKNETSTAVPVSSK